MCCYAEILVSAIKYGHLIPTPVQETEIKFIIVIWIQGTAFETGNSDSCFCRGVEMVLHAVKCRQIFETFLAYSQGVSVTGVKYLLPYLIVLGLF